jgi:hypothetical protein
MAIKILLIILCFLVTYLNFGKKRVTFKDLKQGDLCLGDKFQHCETGQIWEICNPTDLMFFTRDPEKWVLIN